MMMTAIHNETMVTSETNNGDAVGNEFCPFLASNMSLESTSKQACLFYLESDGFLGIKLNRI